MVKQSEVKKYLDEQKEITENIPDKNIFVQILIYDDECVDRYIEEISKKKYEKFLSLNDTNRSIIMVKLDKQIFHGYDFITYAINDRKEIDKIKNARKYITFMNMINLVLDNYDCNCN